jgi:hypothetical protein
MRNASEAPVTLPRGFCFLGTNVRIAGFYLSRARRAIFPDASPHVGPSVPTTGGNRRE